MHILLIPVLRRGIYCTVLLCTVTMLAGCMMLAGRTFRQGYDEMQALDAINRLADRYVYVDYMQLFPDSYRYELSERQMYNKIVKLLKAQGETIIEQDRKKGFIFTAAREAPLPSTNETSDDQDRIYYQLSIYLTAKNNKTTYVTAYPTVLKGDFQETINPLTRNMLRGIFFGSLAGDLYPEKKKKGLRVAKKMGLGTRSSSQPEQYVGGEVVHTVQPGETLGMIAKKYTGNVMDYKKIAEYNHIVDVKKIRVGQVIKIPAGL